MPRRSKKDSAIRNVCFITGSRADFGLMRSVLEAIHKSPGLHLQIIATGMHLDARHGQTIRSIRDDGWKVDAAIPWRKTQSRAVATGTAIAAIARSLESLKTNIVLIVGDRVEAFAGATAGHLLGLTVAHVHGGDRALGLMDDTLRHAITKLAHVHFPATAKSAGRIHKMGEDAWRIHRVGSPGIDGIRKTALSGASLQKEFPTIRTKQFALLALHPADADDALEFERADRVLRAVRKSGPGQIVIIYPNNDPGSNGIIRRWLMESKSPDVILRKNVSRPIFLALLREVAVLVGNTSSGIIEAGSFGTPVIDIGNRQLGREHGRGVWHVRYALPDISKAISGLKRATRTNHGTPDNPYEGRDAGIAIARKLSSTRINQTLLRKIISY